MLTLNRPSHLLYSMALLVPQALSAQTWVCGGNHGSYRNIALTAETSFSSHAAGWDLQPGPQIISKGGCRSSKAFFFSAPLPEGNYQVSIVLGGDRPAETTIKAESRRLMMARVRTRAGHYATVSFLVNVRRPDIAGDGVVKRKPREFGSLDWDEKLTLEFSGNPAFRSLSIRPAPTGTPTVYLAGDSTVVDQDNEPWAAWGQMLPAFFGPRIAIANHAESGETLRSFEVEQRFAKIFSTLTRGDYLFLQFAHNDQKKGSGYVSPDMYTSLLHKYIGMARERGATPVLVTSMNRRTFDAEGHITDTLAPYPATMRKVATEEKVTLLDLNAMSRTLYESIGEANSRSLFVYAPANTYPAQTEPLHDDTHFNSYGAWELARCVVLGLQQQGSPLVHFLRDPGARFDPRHPDTPGSVSVPPSPFVDIQKPYER